MEINTRERILQEALKLFAQNGYMATSMSDIAKQIGITKAGLYKHYESKQEIFDSIVDRMEQMDKERTQKYQIPDGSPDCAAENYRNAPLSKIVFIAKLNFDYWTKEQFPNLFRRMITLEQYKNAEMRELYKKYFTDEPVRYLTELFDEIIKSNGIAVKNFKQIALDFYGPIYLLINMYDSSCNKEELINLLEEHISHFAEVEGLN